MPTSHSSKSPTTDQDGGVTEAVAGGVGTVRFSHPKGNSLPGSLLRRIADSIAALGQDPAVRVIVLRSEGDGPFCAGASFDELSSIGDAHAGERFFNGFARVILAMVRAPKFVLVRVQGRAAGGGVGLAAAGDYTLAARGASARLSELAVGIGPFVVGPAIERRIGTGPFAAMAIDADWRDAEWAERHGLYARVYEDVEALDAAVDALATKLAQSNPQAMAELKSNIWAGTEQWDTLLATRARTSGTLVLSEFTRTAIAGFRARPR